MATFFKDYIGFFVAAVALVIIIFVLSPLVPAYGSDAEWYIALAEGRFGEVIQPFSGRFLQPFLAGLFSSYSNTSIDQSFLIIAIISLIFFFVINAVLFKKMSQPPFFLIPVFLLPYFAGVSRAFFLPDPFYILLIALFFLFLIYRMETASLLILFLLFLTRESTILLGLILLIVGFLRSRKFLAIAVLGVIVISLFTTYRISDLGLPNVHNLPNLSYLVLKMPYNLLNNVFGVKLWVNTLPNNCDPVSVFDLPDYLPTSPINKVGFCGFDVSIPLRTALILLTTFGVMPLALFYLLSMKFKSIMDSSPPWLVIALIYGIVSCLMSVLVTGAVQRSVGYGWPAFLLAAPFLITAFFQIDKRFLLKLSFIQLFVAWLPIVVPAGVVFGIDASWFIFPLILAAYAYAIRLLGAQKKNLVFEKSDRLGSHSNAFL